MSHVDDGRLHAWLDGALAPGTPEYRAVEAHLEVCGNCRSRLEAARRDRDGATGLLGLLGPEVTEGPSFEELRERTVTEEDTPVAPSRTRTLIPLTWAASIAVALGGGWLAHGAWNAWDSVQDGPAGVRAPAGDTDAAAEPPVAGEAARTLPPLPGAVETEAAGQTPPIPPPATVDVLGSAAQEAAPPLTALDYEALGPGAASPELVTLARILAEAEAWADSLGAWRSVTPAQATEHLGQLPFEPDGLPWERMEAATVDGRALVRTLHPLAGGGHLDLLQTRWSADTGIPEVITRDVAAEAQLRASVPGGAEGESIRTLFVPGDGPPLTPTSGVLAVHVGSERLGILLRAPGDREDLEALWQGLR